jgi:hypothetical protein
LVLRDTVTLRPHPAYMDVVGPRFVRDVGVTCQLALDEPLVITREGTIVDGHSRWQTAKSQGLTTLACLEHSLTDHEALAMLITRHSRSRILNAFCRVALALRLEPHFKSVARERLQIDRPDSSKLTDPDRIDVRGDIARIAGVSTGNVTKVKQLLPTAIPDVIVALREGAVSIHQAWQWRQLSRSHQRNALWRYQNRTTIDHAIRRLITQQAQALSGTAPIPVVDNVLARLSARLPSPTVIVVDLPGEVVVITRDLYDIIRDANA